MEEALDEMASLHGATRGLEPQICKVLRAPRKHRVRAVLAVQAEMRQQLQKQMEKDNQPENGEQQRRHNDSNHWAERIQEVSMAASLPNRVYATRMGQYDHMEALKASLSPWRVSTKMTKPNAGEDFKT